MSHAAKTDYIGLARTGLEIVANADNATNQLLEIPGSDGAFVTFEKFGSIKSPHCDYKITGSLTFTSANKLQLGKVHGPSGSPSMTGPYALKTISIHTGAGDEPTFGADAVQIEAGAAKTVCTFSPTIAELSPARHAITFGAFSFTEAATLTLQSCDYTADCEISPTTINGVPKASDAIKAFEQVVATFWTNSDTTAPGVSATSDWNLVADWSCTGSDGAMFVWTATFKKYLAKD